MSDLQNPQISEVSAKHETEQEHALEINNADAVDAHVEQHAPAIKAQLAPSLENPPCAAVYAATRPILLIVKGLFFFKPGWQKGIAALIAALDVEFPTAVS